MCGSVSFTRNIHYAARSHEHSQAVYLQPSKTRKAKLRPRQASSTGVSGGATTALEVCCGDCSLGLVLVQSLDRATVDVPPGESLRDFRQHIRQQLGQLTLGHERALPESYLFCWSDGVAIHPDQEHRLSVLRVAGAARDGRRRLHIEALAGWEDGVLRAAGRSRAAAPPVASDEASGDEWKRLLKTRACVFVSFSDSAAAETEHVSAQVRTFADQVAVSIQSAARAWLQRRPWSAAVAGARARASVAVAEARRAKDQERRDAVAAAERARAEAQAVAEEEARAEAEALAQERAAAAARRAEAEARAAEAAALNHAAWARAVKEEESGAKAAKEAAQRRAVEASRLVRLAQRNADLAERARNLELAEKARRLAVRHAVDTIATIARPRAPGVLP